MMSSAGLQKQSKPCNQRSHDPLMSGEAWTDPTEIAALATAIMLFCGSSIPGRRRAALLAPPCCRVMRV